MEDVNKVFSKVYVYSKDNSSSSDTGAITVEGGVGIKKDLYVSGTIKSEKLDIINLASLQCNLKAGTADLSIGEPDGRFQGNFNEINSNIITNNSKITSSHIVANNKLEVSDANNNISLYAVPNNVTLYGDSFTIKAPTYNYNYTYHFQPVVFNNRILIKPDLINTTDVIDNQPYETSSSLILLTINHSGTKTLKLDTLDMPNYCNIRICCIHKSASANLILNTGTNNYSFTSEGQSIEVLLINGVFFKIGGTLS
jgi:hypothetical protein